MGTITYTPRNLRNFWRCVEVRGWDECWEWTGSRNADGYGVIGAFGHQRPASHVALEISGRPRPPAPDDHALHGDCSNRGCVNFRHLRWGTTQQNVEDRRRLQRTVVARGADHHAAKLTEDTVRQIRSSPLKGYELAALLGVSKGTISLVRNRKVWAHVE